VAWVSAICHFDPSTPLPLVLRSLPGITRDLILAELANAIFPYRGPLATQGAGHFDDGETAADAGLLTGATGEVCFTALTRGLGFRGAGFTAAMEFGFAGPPMEFGFIGAARGVCFLTPPIELWAQAGRHESPPNAAAIKMMAIVLFFMGRSSDV
jgi:hypothetical protein